MLVDDYHAERVIPPFQQPDKERYYLSGHGK